MLISGNLSRVNAFDQTSLLQFVTTAAESLNHRTEERTGVPTGVPSAAAALGWQKAQPGWGGGTDRVLSCVTIRPQIDWISHRLSE
jgi:hypothetical protein